MADSVAFDGKEYISSKRAAELSGYSQDYIGQLARSGNIDARRVGGLWYVRFESIADHEKSAQENKARPPAFSTHSDPDSFVGLDGNDYISASRASNISGYNQDYVGQLARSGRILSRQVGNRWYVDRGALLSHKAEKDGMLAEVQKSAVGLKVSPVPDESIAPEKNVALLSYFSDDGDLIPMPSGPGIVGTAPAVAETEAGATEESAAIPINKTEHSHSRHVLALHRHPRGARVDRRRDSARLLAGAALTIVIIVSVGLETLRDRGIYANIQGSAVTRTASVGSVAKALSDFVDSLVTRELTYTQNASKY